MLKLVKPNEQYKDAIIDMLDEWATYNQTNPLANGSPAAIFNDDWHEFERYCAAIDKINDAGYVPQSTYFCYDDSTQRMVGAVSIRHYLNDYLLHFGGHVGDGIRPSERNKGYGKAMIALALDKCKEMGLVRVLFVCDKVNVASAKIIVANGGELENEKMHDDRIVQRYWITINQA